MKLEYRIIRRKLSYDYKYDSNLNTFSNNIKNNMRDILKLIDIDTGNDLFICNQVQTVANHPKMKLSDTVKIGNFQVKHFVDKRAYINDVHGIINGTDINNQSIDNYSMQQDEKRYIGRWLIHDTFDPKLQRETSGYSGGCFIMKPDKLKQLNNILILAGIKKNDIIDGILEER